MSYYPLFLELQARPVLVIGGGAVAGQKVEALLAAGAIVTVVSPDLTAGLRALADEGRIRHIMRAYAFGDLAAYRLAFVATDDGGVNAAVAQEARARGVWINAADDPAHCDFILPAVVRRGDLVVAISTSGASPALARAIREELEAYLSPDYATLAELVGEVRRELRARGVRPGPEAWRAALDTPLRRLVAAGKRAEARSHLLAGLGADAWP